MSSQPEGKPVRATTPTVNLEILYTPGCGRWRRVAETARAIGRREGIRVRVTGVPVETQTEAVGHRYLGSPTLRVHGRDVEPGAESLDLYGLGCRTYIGPRGTAHEPPEELVAAALRRAAGKSLEDASAAGPQADQRGDG
jgi:hypothetical protein